MAADVSQILIPFGFTSLESEIYTFLLKESPATGYRVAQAIGKAAANTYKGIESLQQKGAVLVEEGTNRMCRAVPSDELLARLTRDFEWRRAEAELHLARLNSGADDDRVYSLRSRAQILERARHILGSADAVALIACSATVANELTATLTSSARRGLDLYVICPEALSIPGIQSARAASLVDELRLTADGSEHLFALFSDGQDEAVQAIWSKSPFLAVCAHRGIAAEMELAGIRPPVASATPGFQLLVRT